MSASSRNAWMVYGQFVVLLAVVALVDNMPIRLALAVVVGLLLAARAVQARAAEAEFVRRRNDPVTREAVGQLLARIRVFYAATHRASPGAMPSADAADAATIERDLNALLERVIRAARGEQMEVAASR